MTRSRTVTAIRAGILAVILFAATVAPAAAKSAARTVSFHGYRLAVPRSWPVFHLADAPGTCVRFNRHALYLGTPSPSQKCPAHAAGRTEAVLVEPIDAGATAVGSAGPVLRGRSSATSFAVARDGVVVTATWSAERNLVSRIVGRPVHTSGTSTPDAETARAPRPSHATKSTSSGYAGLGFDACTTPSPRTMADWASSPFRAIAIYVGGPNSACSQPNLTKAWVAAEVRAGWHLIPTYVGLQGAGSCGGTCAEISRSNASSEGAAAAADAVSQAQALGIPAGNPIYDDMEQYDSSSSGAVLSFLSGWTSKLHADGYLSGVYSSASSGITDLANAYGTKYTEPDDVWIADWNGERTTSDPYVPSADWPGARRLHQYEGDHYDTYGGATIDIDSDYVNGATAGTSSPIPNGTFVEVKGTTDVFRIAGGAPLYVSSWTDFGGPQTVKTISASQFSELPPYPANGTFLTTTTGLIYRIAGGAPLLVSSWEVYGKEQPSVIVDEWDLENISNPLAHLAELPARGTVVKGLPSDTYWVFGGGGGRSPVGVTAGAIGVDDQTLNDFSIVPETGGVGPDGLPSPPCVAPRLTHMTLAGVRRAIRRAHCRLGQVRRPRHWPHSHQLRVYRQSPAARARRKNGFRISVRLR